MPKPDPTFNDDEVREIFAAAAERQSEADEATSSSSGGHSLTALKRIGAEAGIDPAHVEAAARALVRRSARLPVGKGGAGRAVEVSRTLPGPPDDRVWQRVVGALRDEFRSTGVTTRFGDTYEWISSAEGPGNAPIEARLETEKSGPRLTLRQDMGVYRQLGMAMGITFAVMATVFSLVILMGDLEASAFVAPAALLAMGAASWLGTRALTPWVEKRQRARFERVADRIELIAGAG